MGTFGNTGTGTGEDGGWSTLCVVCRYQASETGTVTDISFYLKTAVSGNLKLGIYADSSGNPGALLYGGGSFAVSGIGWKNQTGLSVAVTAGNYYWIAFRPDSDSMDTGYDTGVANQMRYKSVAFASVWPDPYGSDEGNSTEADCVYATYTVTGPYTLTVNSSPITGIPFTIASV